MEGMGRLSRGQRFRIVADVTPMVVEGHIAYTNNVPCRKSMLILDEAKAYAK